MYEPVISKPVSAVSSFSRFPSANSALPLAVPSQMHIGSTISVPAQTAFPVPRGPSTCRGSALNQWRRARASVQTLRNPKSVPKPTRFATEETPNSATSIHLANLEKLLQKETPPTASDPPRENSAYLLPEKKGRGFLNGLNLAGLWQGWKNVADESPRNLNRLSPRNLNRLQRLLSKSEYSPRNNLGDRWMEYHGSKDWAGLLDPLDENLRREVVRYGEFVQAAYQCFHSNPATSDSDPATSRHVALPDRSYKVTKSLYATSSIGLPGWVDDVAPDLGWMTQRSSWIGYVAVCNDEREIARMGRRDIVISLRGTATCLEWAENARAVLVRAPGADGSSKVQPKVECGFWSLYKTPGLNMPSMSEMLVEEVKGLMDLYKGEKVSITVTGHSLGAALALLAADELSTCVPQVPPIAVFSFGGPHVGNRGFADQIRSNGVKVLRVVNAHDVITRVPGVFVSEQLDQKLRAGKNAAPVLNVLDDMPWAYSHVGSELRVDSKRSPYLKPNADVACCHDLEAYLHLVDGFMGSNCPFRENAKRGIAKLLNEQGSNVKKLYTSKALTLHVDGNNNRTMAQSPLCLPSPS